jgi:hypothetical protein
VWVHDWNEDAGEICLPSKIKGMSAFYEWSAFRCAMEVHQVPDKHHRIDVLKLDGGAVCVLDVRVFGEAWGRAREV